MALTKLTQDLNIIQTLATLPNDEGGLTDAQLKAKFDEGINIAQDYINDTLIPEIESTFATKTDITTNRKLSSTGDFTGTLNGQPITSVSPGLDTAFVALAKDYASLSVNVKNPPAPLVAAKGDGTTPDSAVINGILANYKYVYFPEGVYLQNSTIKARSTSVIWGGAAENTIIKRNGANYGNTLEIGKEDGTIKAGNCIVRGIWFLRNFAYTPGVTTTIPDALSASTTHLSIYYGQNFLVENCMFWNAPVNIDIVSSTVGTIRKNTIEGMIYDHSTAGLQEGRACIQIRNSNINTSDYSQLISIYDNHIGGGYASASRSVTVGTATISQQENIGAQNGINISCCEGVSINNNYIGGFNDSSINLNATGILGNVKIYGNFLDPSRNAAIRTSATAGNTILGMLVCDNDFNLQTNGNYSIVVTNTDTTFSVKKLIICNNSFENSMSSHVLLFGVDGCTIANNLFTAYNVHRGGDNNANMSAAIHVTGISKHIISSNNQYGGGVNSLDPTSNGCKWGIYYDSNTMGYSKDEYVIGFGVSGGSAIYGVSSIGTMQRFKISASPTITANTDIIIPFNVSDYTYPKVTLNGNGSFTFNEDGIYLVTLQVHCVVLTGKNASIKLATNTGYESNNSIYKVSTAQAKFSTSLLYKASVNDTITPYYNSDDTGNTIYNTSASLQTNMIITKIS